MKLDERFRIAATEIPAPSSGDPSVAYERGVRRRRRKHAVGAVTGAGLVVAAVVGVVNLPASSPADIEVADRPTEEQPAEPTDDGQATLEVQAPLAGSEASHWPIELVFNQHDMEWRFRGTSWEDWSVERMENGQFVLSDWVSSTVVDATNDEPEFRRVPSPILHPDWRQLVGTGDVMVVPLASIPGGPTAVARLGLSDEDVEAYESADLAACADPLDRCDLDGGEAYRAIAHLETGFPLLIEYVYDESPGLASRTHLQATSFTWADPSIQPLTRN